jgi:hypothetical protein
MRDCRGLERDGAAASLFAGRERRKPEVPSPTSVRTWLLRVGLYQLWRLDQPRSIGRELTAHRVAEKLGWLRDFRESLQKWAQAMRMLRRRRSGAGSSKNGGQKRPAIDHSFARNSLAQIGILLHRQRWNLSPTERWTYVFGVVCLIIQAFSSIQVTEPWRRGPRGLRTSSICTGRSHHESLACRSGALSSAQG